MPYNMATASGKARAEAMSRRHHKSTDCFVCTLWEGVRPVRRAVGLYQIVGVGHRRGLYPYGAEPMSLCRRCALDWANGRGVVGGCIPVRIGDIPPRITRAVVDAALARLTSGADLPSEPCGWDLWRGRQEPEPPPCLFDDGSDLPGDEWKRGGQ